MEVLDEFASRGLLGRPDARQTTGKVERLVVKGHEEMEWAAYTIGKTRLPPPSYTTRSLTSGDVGSYVTALDAKHHSGAST